MKDEKKSLVGRDYLLQLNFRVAEAGQEKEYTNIVAS